MKKSYQKGHELYLTFVSYCAMKSRCTTARNNKKNLTYKINNIKVCKEWQNDFHQFLKDMGKRPKEYTLDRIDPTKGYFPGNCRWATASQQTMNSQKRVDNTSGFKGVWWHPKLKKWRVQIGLNGKRISLGCYENKEEAALVYKKKAEELFKEFARI